MAELRLATERVNWDKLRESRDYRAFLRVYIETKEISLSDLARAAGFGRGFPGDVISGKRRLTGKSCHAFEMALKVPAPARKLFRFLVARDEPDVFPELEPERVLKTIEELRVRPWSQLRRDLQDKDAPVIEQVFRDPRASLIFAAAGDPDRGATRNEIIERTRLEPSETDTVLRQMVSAGLVENRAGKYSPKDLHLFFQSTRKNEMFLGMYRRACLAMADRAVENLASETEFFFTSAFCVSEARLPELKKTLRETILKFIDDSIQSDGDRITKLSVGFHL